jgi:hypothetical protein
MSILYLIVWQIVAHILTDFFAQNNKDVDEKRVNGLKGKFFKRHILIALGLSWLMSFQLTFFFYALVIAVIHGALDVLKRYVENRSRWVTIAFFADQILHIITIVVVVYAYQSIEGLAHGLYDYLSLRHSIIITAYLICLKPANVFIKETFRAFKITIPNSEKEGEDLPHAGKLIGIVERMLVLTFVLLNQYEAVGFLIAAKSILRFKEDERIKSEYVLIGTMLSFGIAIGLGIIPRFL